jgi:hypothetical protein
MSNEIVKSAPAINSMDDLARVSDMLAKSGYFRDASDAAKCGVKVLAGLESGFGAFAAMAGVHIIEGKPSIGANLMALAIKRSGKYNYKVTENTNTQCVVEIFERWDGKWESVGLSRFNMDDAKAAGVRLKDSKGNPTPWAKFPRNMLFARAISNAVRWYCPDCLSLTAYVPEELGADVDDDGNIIDVEATPTQPEKPVQPQQERPVEEEPKLSQKRADAMLRELDKLGFDNDAALELVAETVKKGVVSLAELTETEALTVWNVARRSPPKKKQVEKQPWETWQSDEEAQSYGAKSGLFSGGGHLLMLEWDKIKEHVAKSHDGELTTLYEAWYGHINDRLIAAKQEQARATPRAVGF